MRKTTRFLFGLLIGSSLAYWTLKKMSPLKRQRLMDKVNKKMRSLKKNTIDYAFYANDTLGNTSKGMKKHAKSMANSVGHRAKYFKGQFGGRLAQFNQNGKRSHFQDAASHLHSALKDSSNHDDIILDPDEAFHNYSTVVVYYPDGTIKNC